MDTQELKELIQNGESSVVEFKTDGVHPDALAGEIVAFANFAGGIIILGVGDNAEILGVNRHDVEEFVINVCRNNVKPSIIPVIEKFKILEKQMVVVTIPKGDDVYSTSRGLYFIRVGSTKQQPTQQELLRLFQKRNLIQIDETPVLSASSVSIDINKVNSYLVKLGQVVLDDENPIAIVQDLINLSILTKVNGGEYPTLGGLLFFGKNPQKYFPSFSISCGAYVGKDFNSDTIREKDITGIVEDMIENSIGFLKLTMPQNSYLDNGIQRIDNYLYPIEALREIIVNAICHRDYTITGSSIRILLFSDRLEVRSPGNLPNTLTLESMVYRQFTRNQAIASFLSALGYMEKRGKGILKIMNICSQNNVKCQFSITDDKSEFVVTLSPEKTS